jgi:hypothetical protein
VVEVIGSNPIERTSFCPASPIGRRHVPQEDGSVSSNLTPGTNTDGEPKRPPARTGNALAPKGVRVGSGAILHYVATGNPSVEPSERTRGRVRLASNAKAKRLAPRTLTWAPSRRLAGWL